MSLENVQILNFESDLRISCLRLLDPLEAISKVVWKTWCCCHLVEVILS